MLNWANMKTSREEISLIHKIGLRVHSHTSRDMVDIVMDIEAVHSVTPLDLEGLLNAEEMDFFHDMFGITNHIDRETGELKDCFLPRHAKRQ